MKSIAVLLLLFVATAFAFAGGPVDDSDLGVLKALNKARADFRDSFHPKGLQPFIRVAPLDWLARQTMTYQVTNHDISHDFVPPDIKALNFGWYLGMLAKRTIPRQYWDCYELLAVLNTTSPSLSEIAHVFDTSPEHRRYFYDPQALWIGYNIQYSFTDAQEQNIGAFYVLYVSVLHDEVGMDKVRKLPIPGDYYSEDAWGWGPMVPKNNGTMEPSTQGQ